MSDPALEEFEAWDARLRGYAVSSYAVEPAFPFEPLPRRSTLRLPDDGKRPGLLHTLFGGRAAPRHGESEDSNRLKAAPARDRAIIELQLLVPHGFIVREDLGGALLQALRTARYPISFELIGSGKGVEVQFVAAEDDAALLKQTFGAFYPDVRLAERFPFVESLWKATGDVRVSHVDFGLAGFASEEFSTARTVAVDPLIGIVAALENASEEDECALLQIVFAPQHELWGVEYLDALEALDAPNEVISRAGRKFGQPLSAVTISLSAWSPDEARLDRIIRSIGNALIAATAGEHNMLLALTNQEYPIRAHAEAMLKRSSRRSGMLLSASELFTLVHVPSASVRSTRLVRLREIRTKAAPKIAMSARGAALGVNTHDSQEHAIALSVSQRLRHLYMLGASGTGKSTLLLSLIAQDMEAGHGVALLDPHGDLADQVLAHVPDARSSDVVLVDPADEEYPVGLNICWAGSDLEKTLLASDLVAVFRRLSTSWGDQMNAVLANALIALLEHPEGGTLLDLRRFLVDPEFRSAFLKDVRDPEIVFYWRREFPLLSGRPQAPILTRLDAFLRPKPVRYMVAQKDRSLNFRRVLDERKILICRLSQGAIGEENSHLLGSLIVSKLQQAAMSRQNQEEAARRPFFLYLDEFHHFVTPSLASLLSGVRKYGVGLTLAHQDLQQISGRDSDVSAAALSNPYTRVVFRVGDSDARKLEGGFSFFEARDLQNLGTGEAVARVERADFDFNLKTTPLVVPEPHVAAERVGHVRQHSRVQYATPRADVEAHLRAEGAGSDVESPRVVPRAKGRAARPEGIGVVRPAFQSAVLPASALGNDSLQSPTSPVSERATGSDEVTTPRLPGRGGPEHKYLQTLVRKLGEERGFVARSELTVLDGHGYVDVALERPGVRIGCEISISTRPDHEAYNLAKCLAAGFDYAVLISSDAQRLAGAREALRESDTRNVRFLLPTELAAFLDGVAGPAPKIERQRPPRDADVSEGPAQSTRLAAVDAAAYLGLAVQTLAKFRVTGESPLYLKVGRSVFYERAELDAWLAKRRRRSTSDPGNGRP